MDNQFVNYEIAFELKKLGFDEDCFYMYWRKTGELEDVSTLAPLNCRVINNSSLEDKRGDILFSAPLWQQAVDFIREVKEIGFRLSYREASRHWYFTLFPYASDDKFISEALYATWHEGRTAGLLKAIEMIKYGRSKL